MLAVEDPHLGSIGLLERGFRHMGVRIGELRELVDIITHGESRRRNLASSDVHTDTQSVHVAALSP